MVHLPPLWQYAVRSFFQTYILFYVLENKYGFPIQVQLIETGPNTDPEHTVAYFREDVGLNSHHYHWHLLYPSTGIENNGVPTFKDRQGELFYYMHQQMLARYDAERLSNGLARVLPLDNFRAPIQEGYAPCLTTHDDRPYSMRPSGLILGDIKEASVNTLERWRERIIDAIHEGFFRLPGGLKTEPVNIVNLGAAVQSQHNSPNRGFYGNLNAVGHLMISQIQDPDNRYKTYNGPMGEVETAARDPTFYRWHKFIDDIFVAYQGTLDPYKDSELRWDSMSIDSVTVGDHNDNTLHTFWNTKELDLSQALGINFPKDTVTKVSVTYLDHKEFQYNIEVNNATKETQQATVRIFCAPKNGSAGQNLRADFNQQRRLFIELDKFVETVKPGTTSIKRSSNDSSVTIPPPATFEQLAAADRSKVATKGKYCGCGWPHNLLLPKGTTDGLEMDLFVMITDWTTDQVKGESSDPLSTKNNASYCGLKDKKYPDVRAMGFPFDRPVAEGVKPTSLGDFCRTRANMMGQTIKIKFGEKSVDL